jgi:hypothetical protein
MTLICQPKLTIDVAPCFVLPACQSMVVILHNNGLRYTAQYYNFGLHSTVVSL